MKASHAYKPHASRSYIWRGGLSALGLIGFALLAEEAREGGVNPLDQLVLSVLHTPMGGSDMPPWVQVLTRDITALGGFTILAVVSVFATTMMLIYHQRRYAAVFALTVVMAQATTEGLKALIARPRPRLLSHADIVYSSSFPSGHATMATVVYLALAVILCRALQRSGARALALGTAIGLILAIGITRIELGVHWPTDVLAGWLLGSAIAVTAVTVAGPTSPTL